uniref:Putative secreted protein n=1 Tax=Ixodes ricinus TaxID=34613 RepID=A0A6B0UAW7_IXORI
MSWHSGRLWLRAFISAANVFAILLDFKSDEMRAINVASHLVRSSKTLSEMKTRQPSLYAFRRVRLLRPAWPSTAFTAATHSSHTESFLTTLDTIYPQ